MDLQCPFPYLLVLDTRDEVGRSWSIIRRCVCGQITPWFIEIRVLKLLERTWSVGIESKKTSPLPPPKTKTLEKPNTPHVCLQDPQGSSAEEEHDPLRKKPPRERMMMDGDYHTWWDCGVLRRGGESLKCLGGDIERVLQGQIDVKLGVEIGSSTQRS